ncbi:DUF3320 domain-containing protein [Actinoplanes rectilineatus]|uniref:DUF3320 domain-containing protein n=1 Tax=Actinoplanes rectilineatus TaxID=113571 RepID=UPI0005F2EAAD|nr:DUF3320 domain-containing protein [Actinoplanes rectilineatus]
MRPDPERQSGPGDDARAALAAWRDGIVDAVAAERLVNLPRGGADLIEITAPSSAVVLQALRAGRDCSFAGPASDEFAGPGGNDFADPAGEEFADPAAEKFAGPASELAGLVGDRPEPVGEDLPPAGPRRGRRRSGDEHKSSGRHRRDTVLRTDLPEDVLRPLLRRLRRHTRQEQTDRGVDVLHLAVGLLHWQDRDGAGHASPLTLLPVELVALGPGDVPRLRLGAGDPMINPALVARLRALEIDLPETAPADAAAVRAMVDAAITGRSGWRTTETIVLARLDPSGETVHRDLTAHEDEITAHPMVRALAGIGGDGAFTATDTDPDGPVPLVLDVDADQRACVEAAVRGRSFVVDGPPGTGKSQTVAAMVGALAYAGKRVLVVSEEATALDTVQERLAAAGLGNHLLDLRGARVARRQVASGLAAALDAAPLPDAALSEEDRERLRDRREQLDAYAAAVAEERDPLGCSLHEVIGRFARLADVPEAPAPALQPHALTDTGLERIRAAAGRLSRAWRPAAERSGFRWREVVEKEPLAEALIDAQVALEQVAAAAEPNASLIAAFHLRLPAEVSGLAELAEHSVERPPAAADAWLTGMSLRPVREAADDLALRLDAIIAAYEQVRTRIAAPWERLSPPLSAAAFPEPPRLSPPAVRLDPLTAADAKALAGRFAADADELEHQQRNLDRITHRLRLPEVITFSDVELVGLVSELGGRTEKPEPAWFVPGAQGAVHGAAAALRRHVEAVVAARAQARRYFTEAVLRAPVEDLAERFATVHRGARKLLAPHRRDKDAVAQLAAQDVTVEEAVANLHLAVAWRRAWEGLLSAERHNAAALGGYWKRLETDFPAIGRALRTVDEALRVTPAEGLQAVVDYVSSRSAHEQLDAVVGEAREVFRHWRGTLRAEPEPAARPELGHGSVQTAVHWLRAQVGPLRETAALLEQLSERTGRDLNVAEARTVLAVRQGVLDAEAALTSTEFHYRSALGEAYRGRETDLDAVADAVEWTARARTLRTGADAALNNEQAQALGTGQAVPDLPAIEEAWLEARGRVLAAFGPARQVRLGTALDRYETARDLLRDLLEDDTGQAEWFEYLAGREVLTEFGLDGAIEVCADRGIDPQRLGDVLERTAYRSWIFSVLAEDERLQPLAAVDRNELVDEFRRLDAEQTHDAAARILAALGTRRPSGEATTLIRAEGAKKDGHLPVRDLLGGAWEAVAALKPCLLAPPSTVSRLLPDEARFDVVIIDEASRMTPAAAVACAYRGTSLVIVGDDAQLPPPDGRPSVLVVANDCGGFARLGLTWHYRSRHESLIDFAARTFYQGRLVTFPSPYPMGPDLGVQLFPADGAAAEAALVTQRVVHHFSTRPALSLGVITLSPEQTDGVAAAVEAALAGREDLEQHLGGFFVKSADAAQGDERDVVILVTGTDLGAAGGPAGTRRLDVAITRARQRVEVISAIPPSAREDASGEGERRLAGYLDAAENGTAPAEEVALTALETSVLETIAGWGYATDVQVGTGPCRIEIGVRHSEGAAYVLGVRCDGPGYTHATAARDRDRLHDQVLHGLGWHLHRIWSVSWYADRAEEENRLRVAIENALSTPDVFAEVDGEVLTVRAAQRPEWALPYVRAAVAPLPAGARVNDPATAPLLVGAVERIAEVEGPVHLTTLIRRIRDGWGIGRLTQPVRAAIEQAVRSSRAGFDGTFVTWPDALIPAVRVPGDEVTRKPEEIADPELLLALEYLVLDAGLVEGDDLLAAAARLFGWSGTRPGGPRLAAMLDELVSVGRLIAHPNGLIAAPEGDLLDLPDPATLPRREDSRRNVKARQDST